MAVQQVGGTIVSISAATPATFNAAGYNALSFTPIGEVTDAGSAGGTWAEVNYTPIDTAVVRKFKGSRNEGNLPLQVVLDFDDAGQALLNTAYLDKDDYSFSIEYSDGRLRYFQAKVMSFVVSQGGADTMVTASIELGITANDAGVGIIDVSATSGP